MEGRPLVFLAAVTTYSLFLPVSCTSGDRKKTAERWCWPWGWRNKQSFPPRGSPGEEKATAFLSRLPKSSVLIPSPECQCSFTSRFHKNSGRPRALEKRLQEEAQLYQEEGNQHDWQAKYCDAAGALLQLRGLDPSLHFGIPNLGPQGPALKPERENILHRTQTDCYNNLVACLLQMELVHYQRVTVQSESFRVFNQVLLRHQVSLKDSLIMRRPCVRLFHQQDYDQAQHYLLAAVK
ncbi:Hypothetical predicted protein [Marmota monax]|uniref:Uncharacterized protein n=1 Tax=Marmota monax TaxID=9995 RepID=A0A5E4AZS6_MARMO|nr:hypothetical protein GHT09_006169 [Marmota monax]VTJ62968.1 Hypothetical predicted protein [Marmota monax]